MAKVLILDEDGAFNELVELVARRLGHELTALTSKQEALSMLWPETDVAEAGAAPGDFDVILLDQSFTDGEHADVIEALAHLETEPSLVLLMSPWLSAEPHPGLAALTPSRVLHKPLDIVLLERELAELTGSNMGALDAADTLVADDLRLRFRKSLEADRGLWPEQRPPKGDPAASTGC